MECGGPCSGVPTQSVYLRSNWLWSRCVWACVKSKCVFVWWGMIMLPEGTFVSVLWMDVIISVDDSALALPPLQIARAVCCVLRGRSWGPPGGHGLWVLWSLWCMVGPGVQVAWCWFLLLHELCSAVLWCSALGLGSWLSTDWLSLICLFCLAGVIGFSISLCCLRPAAWVGLRCPGITHQYSKFDIHTLHGRTHTVSIATDLHQT